MSLDWNQGALAEGLACYRRGEFFVTHEHWESVWLTLEDPEKSFLQALIQMSAAFHHLQSGNPAGALSLLRRTQRRLNFCPDTFAGIEVAPLHAEISAWLESLESHKHPRPTTYPQIRLIAASPSADI